MRIKLSQVIAGGEYIRKKCRKEFINWIEAYKQLDIDKRIKKMQESIEESKSNPDFVIEMNHQITLLFELKNVLKQEDIEVAFENFFKTHPMCMPSRSTIFRKQE